MNTSGIGQTIVGLSNASIQAAKTSQLTDNSTTANVITAIAPVAAQPVDNKKFLIIGGAIALIVVVITVIIAQHTTK